jgi:hypothetical protein
MSLTAFLRVLDSGVLESFCATEGRARLLGHSSCRCISATGQHAAKSHIAAAEASVACNIAEDGYQHDIHIASLVDPSRRQVRKVDSSTSRERGTGGRRRDLRIREVNWRVPAAQLSPHRMSARSPATLGTRGCHARGGGLTADKNNNGSELQCSTEGAIMN